MTADRSDFLAALKDRVLIFDGAMGTAIQGYSLDEGDFSAPGRPRWVSGSMGPGTKLPTLGHTTFDALRESYAVQAQGLVEGGCDVLQIETCQDLLQVKAAIAGAELAFERLRRRVPLIVQVTIETTGTMLLGSEVGAALAALEPFAIDVIGIN